MGRKKLQGERYHCGKLRPERSPSAIRQMVSLAEKKLLDPLFGSQVGILHLQGTITASQVSAAKHFAEQMGYYDAVMGNPSRTAKSPDYEMGRAGWGSSTREASEDRISKLREWRENVNRILSAPAGREWRIVYDTVLLDYHCPVMDRTVLASALQDLALLFGYERHAPQALDAKKNAA